ncbi:MAG: hypothetical protein JST54_27100 [Deltaproteobacteria bacterium]|nr:hypothetical protein [Deltaproteobacteria bacterium]
MDDRKKLYALLSAPFPPEAIERTQGSVTGKGYDTAGVRAQYLINRLNEVLGVGCFRIHRTVSVKQSTSPKGRTIYEAIVDMTLEIGCWENGQFVVIGEALADGGHTAFIECDAKKGATTNALKRACAQFGIGKAAWEGTLDDDNAPLDDRSDPTHATHPAPPVQHPAAAPPMPTRASNASGGRNRLTSKQLGAIFAAARKLGFEQAALRAQVKLLYGAMPEFLTSQQASELITSLNSGAIKPNGHDHSAEKAG